MSTAGRPRIEARSKDLRDLARAALYITVMIGGLISYALIA